MKVLIALTIFVSAVYTQSVDTVCQAKGNGYLVAHPTDKKLFYHCDNCIGVLKCCPAGLIFNEAIQVCVWPGYTCGGNCGTGPTSTPPVVTVPPVTTTSTTTTTTTTTTPIPTTTSTTTTTTPRPTAPPVITPAPGTDCCELGQYRPHGTDRCKYIVCDHGRDTVMCCPAGLEWNDAIKSCSWCNIGCNTCVVN